MAGLLKRIGKLDFEHRWEYPRSDAYGSLLRSITGQQLSTTAARTIFGRLLELFGGRPPTPAELLAANSDDLRAAGLSGAKVTYARDLADHIERGDLRLDRLHELPDEEVSRELTAVKGLGQWTADMFMIFHLGRPDVLPVGDLGVRRGAELSYGLVALPKPAELLTLAEPWRPYRSLASLYLWESLVNPATHAKR